MRAHEIVKDTNVDIIRVEKNSPGKKDFIRLYKEVFAGAPYFEKYSDEYVEKNVWNKHFDNDGWVFLAVTGNNHVIGFGCAVPTLNSWESGDFLLKNREKLPFFPESSFYMSEVGVDEEYRKKGIGTKLIEARVEYGKEGGFSSYVMRTASEGSNSKNMYLNFGANIIEKLIQDVSEHAEEVSSKSEFRIYLYGNC